MVPDRESCHKSSYALVISGQRRAVALRSKSIAHAQLVGNFSALLYEAVLHPTCLHVLPDHRIGTAAQTVWAMQAWALVRSGGILSAIAFCLRQLRRAASFLDFHMLRGQHASTARR
jgi:hypothetical protein